MNGNPTNLYIQHRINIYEIHQIVTSHTECELEMWKFMAYFLTNMYRT